jgi:hypothetical protein
MLGECQQLFKEREEELIGDVNYRERVIEDKSQKFQENPRRKHARNNSPQEVD